MWYDNIILPKMGIVNPFWVVCDKIFLRRRVMRFCERLKTVRVECNLLQKDVCEELGVSLNCYASYEQGRTEPNLETLKKLCKLFDVSADYLLGLVD